VRISGLTAFQVRIRLRRPIRHASFHRHDTDNIIVRATLADGTEGFGEGVPRSYVTGETIDSAMELLRASHLPGQITDLANFAHAAELAERIQLKRISDDDRECRGNAARCAVELAILDAYGRFFGRPLAAVTEALAPELYKPRDKVRYSGAITSAQGLKAWVAAWRLRLWRFSNVKVKVGIAGQDDSARLRIIRRVLGAKRDLRLDANEAWPPETIVERFREFERFGVSAVEQPVPHENVVALAAARRTVKMPVILDESVCSLVDAKRAVADQTCDIFNIRLSKCGGFIPSLRLVQFARSHGIDCQLGCQVGETAILSAAGRHFASSVADLRYVEGSYDRYLVRESLATNDITFGWGGWARALPGPGLGIDIDRAALARVTVRKESLLG
jgi:muconate cycloisomerase